MQKLILRPMGILALTLLVSFAQSVKEVPPGSLVGRWQSKTTGATVINIFRADSTFYVLMNGKLFVNGKYKISGDTVAISDPSCGLTYYGKYKLQFFAPDSVKCILIEDACRGRSRDMNGGTMGRVKPGSAK